MVQGSRSRSGCCGKATTAVFFAADQAQARAWLLGSVIMSRCALRPRVHLAFLQAPAAWDPGRVQPISRGLRPRADTPGFQATLFASRQGCQKSSGSDSPSAWRILAFPPGCGILVAQTGGVDSLHNRLMAAKPPASLQPHRCKNVRCAIPGSHLR